MAPVIYRTALFLYMAEGGINKQKLYDLVYEKYATAENSGLDPRSLDWFRTESYYADRLLKVIYPNCPEKRE